MSTAHTAAREGLFAHLIAQAHPALASHIRASGTIETAVYGLGEQGRRHAALMRASGTNVAAAVAMGHPTRTIHEDIPVYDSVAAMLREHPRIAAISIWKHYSSAPGAAMEAIEARIPIVVLIAEGIPVRDAQRLRAAAQRNGVLLFGPNTPGIVMPPERIKIGMLPDIFQAAETPAHTTPEGITIISRSGAILYHMSDALCAAGIAQNAVLGIGGDAVVGADFLDLVPRVMTFPGTHAVVIAGEIGGAKEEHLARDMQENPGRYPKPLIALLSGRYAPAGKAMGHAGALITPGAAFGAYDSKRTALRDAGATVVNGQTALVRAVRRAIGQRVYFSVPAYRARMRELWEAPPPRPVWHTHVTHIAPNRIAIRGQVLESLIGQATFLETAALLVTGTRPDAATLNQLNRLACAAAATPAPRISNDLPLAQYLAACLLAEVAPAEDAGPDPAAQAATLLGRVARCIADYFYIALPPANEDFATIATAALYPLENPVPSGAAAMLEAILVACVDHGVTPPSAQATRIAASVRAPFNACIASGLNAITHVHGGAGMAAAEFFNTCARTASDRQISPLAALESVMRQYAAEGKRIDGLGHRVHTEDPRRNALWRLADAHQLAGEHAALARAAETAFYNTRGLRLPINVDGVIGAIIADLNLPPIIATAIFLLSRTAGLAAHAQEEAATQPPMRQIIFQHALFTP